MYYAPAPRRGLPTWLMSIVFTLAFGGLLAGGYLGYQRYKDGKDAPAAEVPPPETKSPARGAAGNPVLRQIEVGGLRITQGKDKKPQIRFLLINHSAAELGELSGTLQLMAKDESVGSCNFKMSGLGAYEAKEVSMPLNTKMQAYELPDWQFLRAELSLKTP
jgi:hypothetical protein